MRDFSVPGRSAAVAANGMVATSAPMATLAGLDVLRAGGNAMDAAIAAVAMQSVVEPHSTGIGGDCFVLYSKQGALPVALNGSGRAPAAATVEWFLERQIHQIHTQTAHAVTVPGAVDAWCLLNREHGTKPLAELLEPAARAAEDGYRVTPRVAWDWGRNQWKLQDPITAAVMLPGGKPPGVGDRMRNPALAATLRLIGREGREAFYAGPVMDDILGRLKELGGLHEEEDFAAQRSNWVEPIHAPYRGCEVYELPPNGQGLAALMILRQLEGFALGDDSLSEADRLHILAEATKNAYRVRDDFIADPSQAAVDVEGFLSDAWAEKARQVIRLDRAMPGPDWIAFTCRQPWAKIMIATHTRASSNAKLAASLPRYMSPPAGPPVGPRQDATPRRDAAAAPTRPWRACGPPVPRRRRSPAPHRAPAPSRR